jgi:hypothetical protein
MLYEKTTALLSGGFGRGLCLWLCFRRYGRYAQGVGLLCPGLIVGEVVVILKDPARAFLCAHGPVMGRIEVLAVYVNNFGLHTEYLSFFRVGMEGRKKAAADDSSLL